MFLKMAYFQRGSSPLTRGKRGGCGLRAIPRGGSSPLTRGKLRSLLLALVGGRLIPAHAGKTRRATTIGSHAGAHPRSRGENETLTLRVGEREGSSPLTRGKPSSALADSAASGLIPAHAGKTRGMRPSGHSSGWLIPAHAGKTSAGLGSASASRAHPRSRGENIQLGGVVEVTQGSSPLTRGKPSRPAQ